MCSSVFPKKMITVCSKCKRRAVAFLKIQSCGYTFLVHLRNLELTTTFFRFMSARIVVGD